MRVWSLGLVVAQLAAGCTVGGAVYSDADGVEPADAGGSPDSRPDSPPPPPPDEQMDQCADRARWIYVVDTGRALLRFEPDTRYLTRVGVLECPAGAGATPFSMAIDRTGNAWVLYNTGDLFRVSTEDASCERTTFRRNQAGFDVFGMGFASNAVQSDEETLFLAGGSLFDVGVRDSQLGRLDLDTMTVTAIGAIEGSPELTGTADAELWGFSPAALGGSAGSVRQFDKMDGRVLASLPLGQLESAGAQAWAFAFWGGAFYVFISTFQTSSTEIWKVERESGRVTRVVADTGYDIVGAGVSTCAPFNLI